MNILSQIENRISLIKELNPKIDVPTSVKKRQHRLQKVLIANRGEIAKRFFLSLREEGIPSVAVITDVDHGQSWYEFADEVLLIGSSGHYMDIPSIIAACVFVEANAIYPGYGFLSESLPFIEAIENYNQQTQSHIIFMGPDAEVLRRVGDKLPARELAKKFGVPLFEGSPALQNLSAAQAEAAKIGYPVIIKLNAGGGGKGMQPVYAEEELPAAIESCQRIGRNLYQNDTFYLERFITKPMHFEVQIFNGTAIGIRKCAVQRRNQKVVEESGDTFLENKAVMALISAAENMGRVSGYSEGAGAGTVEFLYDSVSKSFGFMEMNTRLQVEHPVTDQSLGVDLAKWQILFFDGREDEIPLLRALTQRFTPKDHAIECRIYAEDPENEYAPSPGRIQDLLLPTFNGIRCDFGFKKGDSILPYYDPMIGKIIAHAPTRAEALIRMERALSELYIKGIYTNINQLINLLRHPSFKDHDYSNRILDENKEITIYVPDEEEAIEAAIFGALEDYRRILQSATADFLSQRDLENSDSALKLSRMPYSFLVSGSTFNLKITILQNSFDTYYIYVNDVFRGELQVAASLEEQYSLRYQNKFYSTRVDKRSDLIIIRIRYTGGLTRYYRLKIVADGNQKNVDPAGMLRSPFQGSFVKFVGSTPLKVGDSVKKGQALLIIEAMKMETTLYAKIAGRVTQVIENGQLSKLQLATLSDGRIIGKPLTEGEVLLVITEDLQMQNGGLNLTPMQILGKSKYNQNPLSWIFTEQWLEKVSKNPQVAVETILEILQLYLLGILPKIDPIATIISSLKNIPTSFWKSAEGKKFEATIIKILNNFINVKQIYSSGGEVHNSYFNELSTLILSWQNKNFVFSKSFEAKIAQIFEAFNIANWSQLDRTKHPKLGQAFLFLHRAFHHCLESQKLIGDLILILAHFKPVRVLTLDVLTKIIQQEQTERDDSLAILAQQTLQGVSEHGDGSSSTFLFLTQKYLADYQELQNDPLTILPTLNRNFFVTKMEQSLQALDTVLVPNGVPIWVSKHLQKKFDQWSQTFAVKRLFSPVDGVTVYLLKNLQSEQQFYYIIATLHLPKEEPQADFKIALNCEENNRVLEFASINAIKLLRAYQNLRAHQCSEFEVLMLDNVIEYQEQAPFKNKAFQHKSFLKLGISVLRLSSLVNIASTQLYLNLWQPVQQKILQTTFDFAVKKSRLQLKIVEQTPLDVQAMSTQPSANDLLFYRNKWPLEVWVENCFDPGSFQEVLIESIDQPGKVIGCKIFVGNIEGQRCYCYLKDSRVRGGATGDLEGLKYLAATYLSYQTDLPIYVFNDGAGANIQEGIVALNRAAEGFMMNTLIGKKATREEFFRYTHFHPDPKVRTLFAELDQKFSLTQVYDRKICKNNFMVAVGIGSSTGLDVYGSSQAPIQIMVDDEYSFRVLTGSNVIKSVTGEDLTNYQIGGARIMGKWSGIVDIVAKNKFELVNLIKQIQKIFGTESSHPHIMRSTPQNHFVTGEVVKNEIDVINEDFLLQNVDEGIFLPIKADYVGSEALLSVFARLGGRRVLVLGPRTHFGLRNLPCYLKAKESLVMAHNTATHQILIFGKRWYSPTFTENYTSVRASLDFINSLHHQKGLRIHIITHSQGLRTLMINSSADVIIFVKQEHLEEREYEFARQIASFIVKTKEEAFALAQQLIQRIDPLNGTSQEEKSGERKHTYFLPSDLTQPFDMVQNIILPMVDAGSLIEFYKEMNDPFKGPSLITAVATMGGQSVAIMADQPTIMGGAPDAPGTDKFRLFTQFAAKNKLPIVMLSNAPGFVPGIKQERLRIQAIGAESLDANILSKVPVVSVVINQNYGGRQIHAFSKFLRPGIVYLAFPHTLLAVMGAQASFDLLQKRKYEALKREGKHSEADAFRENYIKGFHEKSSAKNEALRTGLVDWLISDLEYLREDVLKGLSLAKQKIAESFLSSTSNNEVN